MTADRTTLTVAVLGTGIMGAAMARNLARAGHAVRAWNRSREKAEPLAADGVLVTGDPAGAVQDADVVVTMLRDASAVLETMRRAAPALRPGTVWVQSTTVGLADIPELAGLAGQHELAFFDAPVSGTREPAEAGQLIIMAAGPAGARSLAGPVFDAIGARTVWTGDDGAAGTSTRLKLVVNSWVITTGNAAGEIVALARALDVPPESFLDIVAGGPLDSAYLRTKIGLLREDKLAPPSFAAATAAKDAGLIADAAAASGVRLDGVEAAGERLRRAGEAGHSGDDLAAAYYASFTGEPPS